MSGLRSGQEGSEEHLLLGDGRRDSYGTMDEKKPRRESFPSKSRTPLPWSQLRVIIFMRLAEPIAYTQIFPYINLMIRDLGLVSHPSQAGYYSGLVDSVFAFAELLTVMGWGKLSDKIGRKPVLMMGLMGAAVTTLLFGFSKSFIFALTMRALAGGLSGNVPVLQSVVGDITDKTNEVKAFSIFTGSWNIAQISGPFVGGTFAHPEYGFPNTFGKIELFNAFPYLLPCLVSATYTLAAVILGLLFLRETRHRAQAPNHDEVCIAAQGPTNESTWRVATDARLAPILVNYFVFSFIDMSLFVVFTLFASSPIDSGGLSRNPAEIGKSMACSGIAGALLTMFVLPVLQSQFNVVSLYRFLLATYPLQFLLFPLLNLIARYTVQSESGPNTEEWPTPPAGAAVWTGIVTILVVNRMSCMAFSLNQILVKNNAPSQRVRGVAFSLSHLANCVSRAIAPTFVSTLFSFSQDIGWFGGNLIWIVMSVLSFLCIWSSFRIRDYGQ